MITKKHLQEMSLMSKHAPTKNCAMQVNFQCEKARKLRRTWSLACPYVKKGSCDFCLLKMLATA